MHEQKTVLVELCVPGGTSAETILTSLAASLPGFTVDLGYTPIPISPSEEMRERRAAACQEAVLIRGQVQADKEQELRSHPNVIALWGEGRVAAFDDDRPAERKGPSSDEPVDRAFTFGEVV